MTKLNEEDKIVDKYRLIHWLNIRKTTVEVLNELLINKINKKISFDDFENLDMYTAKEIANVLSIPVSNILKVDEVPSFLFSSKIDLEKDKSIFDKPGFEFKILKNGN